MKNITNVLIFLATLAVSLSALAQGPGEPTDEPRTVAQLTLDDLRAFADVFNQIRRNYVGEVDDKQLLDAAIRGMLAELDPHSDYLPTTEYQDLEDNSRGRYSGIGIDVQVKDQKILVKSVINGSPADKAGINPDDTITAIGGKRVKGRNVQKAIDDLIGEPGSDLVLTVLPPKGKEREIRLQRRYLNIPTISFQILENSYGYFKISFFHQESATNLKQALDSVKADDIVLNGLILDLRNNPGGVLQPAIAIADGFLDEGLIVSTRGHNEAMQLKFEAHPGQWLPETPLIILVDRGSASASEVLAGALQDHGRALIVGEKTFGKGTVQSVLPMRNGGGIKLTTAMYYTPSGRSIQAKGIQPDVVLNPEDFPDLNEKTVREADLERHLDQDSGVQDAANGEPVFTYDDFPLEEALNILRDAGILNTANQPETSTRKEDQP